MPATLSLLGPPRVLTDSGAAHELPDALPGYLLAYLGARGDWVAREELATLLWPDAPAEQAQHNLRVNLNRLRGLLQSWGIDEGLVAERRRLRLALPVDADTTRNDGRFLEGLSFRAFPAAGEWAQQQRERRRADWRHALLKAAEVAPPDEALALTERLAPDERLAEHVQQRRLSALVALGRADDAQREDTAFRAALRSELDAAPSATYEAFAAGCLARPEAGAERTDPADAFIGRSMELQQARAALERTRLLTLTGLGGVGKTRLARTLQAELAPAFTAGSRWLPLAELAAPGEVLGLLADAVGAATAADRSGPAAVSARLADGRWLLVFDNAEHLIDAEATIARLVDALLAACPALQVIVTSREPLGLPQEAVLRLQGLALARDAARLFAAHARRAQPAFDALRDAAAVARITTLTGGLPLALRMAAGWLRWLSCAQVSDELQLGLDALDPAGRQGVPPGVQGVRATLERSWQRLPPEAAAALARLAVFAGPFDPAAAREVAAAGLPLLAELAEVSMLEPVEAVAGGARRLQLHPLVRQAALQRLDREHAAGTQARAAHRRWLARALAPLAGWQGADQRAVLERTGALIDELRAAWRSATEHGDAAFFATAAPVLMRYFEQKGLWNESLQWFTAPQPQLDPTLPADLAALAALARAQALMLYRKTDLDAAELVGRRALAWARALDHAEGIMSNLNTLGLTLLMQGRSGEARGCFEEAATRAAAEGNGAGEAVFSANIGLVDKRVGDYAAAIRAWRRSLGLHRELGNWRSAVTVLNNLGNLLRIEGRFDEAQPLMEEGLRLCDEHGFTSTRSFLLINLARLHADAGRDTAAAQLAQATLEEQALHGEVMLEAAICLVLAQLALRRGELGTTAGLLARALRCTASTGDMPNRLEAMEAYGHWLAARGRADDARAVWQLLLAHPALHAELRTLLLRQLGGTEVSPAPGRDAADFGAWCERAGRELERAAA